MLAHAGQIEHQSQPPVRLCNQGRHQSFGAEVRGSFIPPDQRQKLRMVPGQQFQVIGPLRIEVERCQRERCRAGVISKGVVGDRRAHADFGGAHHEVVFLLVSEAELFTESAVIGEHLMSDEHVIPDAGRAEVELRQCPAEHLAS